jgi:hypothetical protein
VNAKRERYSHSMLSDPQSEDFTTLPAASRHTENRHTTPDKTCHHFISYDLTCEDFDRLHARAAGRCELCDIAGEETPRGSLVIDHFQGGGLFFVRGLLCDKCNSVMSRHDRTAAWGPASESLREKAQAYHLNAFSRPTPEQFERAAAYIANRKPFNVADRPPLPRYVARPSTPPSPLRLDRGVKHIAAKLRRHLNAKQISRLIELLQEAP